MTSAKDHYYITVIEDTVKGTIIGAATLFVEYKFIRQCTKVNIVPCMFKAFPHVETLYQAGLLLVGRR